MRYINKIRTNQVKRVTNDVTLFVVNCKNKENIFLEKLQTIKEYGIIFYVKILKNNNIDKKGMKKMNEEIVVITGGDGKIARAIVERYLNNGSKVIAIDRKSNTDKKEFLSDPNYEYYQADITDARQLVEIKEKIEKKEGKITHLISAAGCPVQAEVEGLKNATIEEIDESIKLNLNAHIYCTKIFLPLLEKEKNKNKSIIMISSVNALRGFDLPAYSAGKAGIFGFMNAMTRELAKEQIRINVISPGTTATEEEIASGSGFVNYKYKTMIPLGEFTHTTDIADAVFALTHITKAVTGQNLVVDSGQTV